MASIPASQLVSVTPNVLSAGGSALDLLGLILTSNARVPSGGAVTFVTPASVAAYFGAQAIETQMANVYFLGFDNSNKKPGALLFAQYPQASIAAFLRSGSLAGLSLAGLQALTGTITLVVDGISKTSASLNFSSATSFSNAATMIQSGFTSPGFTVAYDSIMSAFTFTSNSVGNSSTITFAGGTLSVPLALTSATGAVISQGAVAGTPATILAQVIASTNNWATFTTAWEPNTAAKLAFASWNNSQNNRYAYVMWDSDATPGTTYPATASAGYIANAINNYSGTIPEYLDPLQAAFTMGYAASLDFTELNGRTTLAYRSQSGLPATVTDANIANNLKLNGYNFYGAYTTANDQFILKQPGQVTGLFDWVDTYLNEIAMTNAFQLALMKLLQAAKSIPYNFEGRIQIEAALADPIGQFLDFGAIRAGVTLSALQIAQVNAAAGVKIDNTLTQRGWYLQVKDALPIVRAARQSPPCTFWYTDGGSVQQINLTSVEIQ